MNNGQHVHTRWRISLQVVFYQSRDKYGEYRIQYVGSIANVNKFHQICLPESYSFDPYWKVKLTPSYLLLLCCVVFVCLLVNTSVCFYLGGCIPSQTDDVFGTF